MNLTEKSLSNYNDVLESIKNNLDLKENLDFYEYFLLGFILEKYHFSPSICIELMIRLQNYKSSANSNQEIIKAAYAFLYHGKLEEAALLVCKERKDAKISNTFYCDYEIDKNNELYPKYNSKSVDNSGAEAPKLEQKNKNDQSFKGGNLIICILCNKEIIHSN